MLNSTKTWQERFDDGCMDNGSNFNFYKEEKNSYDDEYRKALNISEDFMVIKYPLEIDFNKIKQFISDLRKRDMEALIGMLPKEISMSVAIDTNSDAGAGYTIGHNYLLKDVKKLIKDYYEN